MLAADSVEAGSGELLYGVQTHRYDGPWTDVDEDLQRNNLLLRYSSGADDGGWNVALMGYDASGTPPTRFRGARRERADRPLGSIDTTLGGDTRATACPAAGTADSARAGCAPTPTSSTTT